MKTSPLASTKADVSFPPHDPDERGPAGLFALLGEPLLTFDSKWRLTYANPAAKDFLKPSHEQVLGKAFRDVFPPTLAPGLEREYECTKTQRTPSSFEFFQSAEGTWFELNVYPMAEGGIVIIGRNITNRKAAEAELNRVNESLALALKAAEMGTWDLDLTNDQSARRNARHDEIFGYSQPQQKWGMEIAKRHVVEADREIFDRAFATMIQTGELRLEVRVRRPGGKIRWINAFGRVYHEAGQSPRAAGVVMDNTDRKQAEEDLGESEKRFQALVHASAQVLWRMTADGKQCLALEGGFVAPYSVQKGPTSSWLLRYLHPEDRKSTYAVWRQAVATKCPFEHEHRAFSADGAYRYVHSRGIPLLDESGQVREWVGMSADITKRKTAEAELRQAQENLEKQVLERTTDLAQANKALQQEIVEHTRAKQARQELEKRLISAQEEECHRISRELHDDAGQYITALKLGLRSLQLRITGAEHQHTLSRLADMTQTLGQQVHDLAVRLRPTALDDLGLVSALRSYIENWAEQTNIDVEFCSRGMERERLPRGVETTFYRIVQEALNNVCKHARASCVVVILAWQRQDAIVVVEDNGAGFDVEAEFRIEARKNLGLNGMKERAALLGGAVTFESSLGKGTTVFTRIPIESNRPAA